MTEENFIFCPLECGARIKSLSKHILKCKNNKLLGVTYKRCEYNPYHIIKNEFYDLHLLSCDSKKKIEKLEHDSNDDDLIDKLDEEDENDEINNRGNVVGKENIDNKNINDDEEIKEKNKLNKRKRRYNHEKALFKDESEIDKECLDFFNKVYV